MSESDNIENLDISPDNSGLSHAIVPSPDVLLETIIDCEIFNNERFSIQIPEEISPTSDPINDNYADDVIIHTCQSAIIRHIRRIAQYIHSYNNTAVHDIQFHEPDENVQSNHHDVNITPSLVISLSFDDKPSTDKPRTPMLVPSSGVLAISQNAPAALLNPINYPLRSLQRALHPLLVFRRIMFST